MIVITGSSASGKTEIARLLQSKYGLSRMVTCTTRPKRFHEIDGVDYHFYSEKLFKEKLNNNEFIETTKYHNYYYGSLKSDLKQNSVLVLNPEGVNAIHRIMKAEALIIYLSTSADIRRKRMISRNDLIEEVNYRIENDDLIFNADNLNHIDYIIDTDVKSVDILAREIYELAKTPKH